ncbi:FdrA family protein [Spiractinospora alimapuensis]|nr:FdrA family protein [Spiractinospora alimapuensis]
MLLSREVATMDGVADALVGMGTAVNLQSFTEMGAPVPSDVAENDLIVAVQAADPAVREAAFARAEAGDATRPTGATGGGERRARSVRTAARVPGQAPASLALVSVPGPHAAGVALEALNEGLDVMVFSDNVPLKHEIALKRTAERLGRLVMGPDCGTAVLQGACLGFANVTRPGTVGVVAASGTGAQHLMSLLDAAHVGVSHCLGVGGRDLSEEVGASSAVRALDILDADPQTDRIVVISKPPAPAAAERLTAHAATLSKPVHTILLGTQGQDITSAVEEVLHAQGVAVPEWPQWAPGSPGGRSARSGALRGLYCGGTLAEEALLVVEAELGAVSSNLGKRAAESETPHRVVDFGADEFTQGRPHPMIDPMPREEQLRAELLDEDCAVVLLDVVLGHGAHPDPASGVAAVVRDGRALGSTTPVIVSLCGTQDDPQDLTRQAETLQAAGAEVYVSNAAAARRAARLAAGKD